MIGFLLILGGALAILYGVSLERANKTETEEPAATEEPAEIEEPQTDEPKANIPKRTDGEDIE